MTQALIHYRHGFEEKDRQSAAQLYDQAFGIKFASAIPSKKRRVDFLAKTFCPGYCFAAYRGNELIGLAGYHDHTGSLTGGITYSSLLWNLGPLRGNWAAFIFSFYEHTSAPDLLIMDGIAVAESARGQGIGSKLLRRIIDHATAQGFSGARLDVIEGNDRAKQLYEREGFVVTKSQKFGYLRWLLKFGASETMVKETNL
jgi:ribosomal protein S18 acetylase RimI-like enzyme